MRWRVSGSFVGWLALLSICACTGAAADERRISLGSITLVSGFAPGGGDAQGSSSRGGGPLAMRPRPVYDLTARLNVRHFGRFLPGSPAIVLTHMPGAGSLRAARWLLRDAPRDGLTLLIASGDAWRELMLATGKGKDDLPAAIGGLGWGEYLCAGRKGATPGAAMAFGATAPRDRSFVHARAFAAVSASALRIVSGYANTSQIALAFRRREIDGFCGLAVSTIRVQLGDAMMRGELMPLARIVPPGAGSLRQIPRLSQMLPGKEKSRTQTAISAALSVLEWQGAVDMALFAPPGVPQDRLAMLRAGYDQMVSDDAFRREAVRWGLNVDPVRFNSVEKGLARIAAASKDAGKQLSRWSGPASALGKVRP